MKTLYILRGLPGSGKSALSNTIVDSIAVCEADQYFVDKETGEYKFNPDEIKIAHQWCKDEVENRMKYNQDTYGLDYSEIVVSNTFTQEWEMDPYFKLAEKYGYRVFSLIVENRHGGKNTHGVPDEKVEVMKNRFQVKL
jgi:ABC-type molybdenum transport system ATPase subunit/photorepair protein PhrA